MQKTLEKKKPAATEEVVEHPLLADLNPEQRKAVTHENGPLLIIAGAGTGKTTVISRRVAWLINQAKAKPEEILALTFTDKAAGEMTERIDTLLPMGYVDLWVSTFHAFCQRILKDNGLDIGLPNDFRLLNETDAYLLVRKHFDRFNLEYYRPMGNPTKFIHALLRHFSRAKDEAVTPKEYLAYAKELALNNDKPTFDAEDVSRQTELANAYRTYEQLLLENGCIDLGDLNLYAIELFKRRPRILERYQKQFRHVVVDEFQDTNWAQYALIKMLTPKGGNIVVVGDDDQSIYKFRGASVSNILQFKNDFPSSKEVVLTKNYRSRQNILDLSYSFIQLNNPNRLEAKLAGTGTDGLTITKKLRAEREDKAEIAHLHFVTLDEEVGGVVDKIIELKDTDAESTWSDFCILVRANAGADDFSRELHRRGIPYQFLALKGLYAKPLIMDCLAYFALLDNYHESPALYRVLSSPPYHISGEDLIFLTHETRKKAVSLYETLKQHALVSTLQPDTHRVIDKLMADLAKHSLLARSKSVTEVLISFIYDSGYAERFKKDDTIESREQVRHLKQLMDRLKRFEAGHDEPTLKHFMEEFALERESGEEGGLSFDVETGPDMVRIMTVHAAKGLEFRHVFVVNMVDKRFPIIERGGDIDLPDALTKEIVPDGDIHLEEERRLFYVAMTRAKDGLYFSSAEDYGGKLKKKMSRFLSELGFEKPQAAPSVAEAVLEASSLPAEPPSLPDYAVPKYFSFTQLAAYAKCPLQYKFAHVVKIPVFGKPQLSFGKTMHAVLERFLNELVMRKTASQETLFGAPAASDAPAALPVSYVELLKMYEEAWQDDWYPDRPTKEKYREKGRAILEAFYASVVKAPPDPLFLEKDFKLKVGAFWIKGKIDRIDKAADGKVEIIDYKTGTPKEGETVKTEDKKQLLLYQVAVGRLMGLTPVRLTYHYLEDGSTVSFLGTEADIAKFEEDAEKQINKITGGDFTPTPGMHCKFCDFAGICEFRQ